MEKFWKVRMALPASGGIIRCAANHIRAIAGGRDVWRR
jgi:hypothetical protein